MTTEDYKLPAVQFEDEEGYSDRLIKGEIAKCVDARWSVRDGTELKTGESFLCTGTTQALQRFLDNVPQFIPREPGKPLPDPDDLNAEIPEEEWELGLSGEKRPPWQRVYVVYLIRLHDASMLTFISGTAGARIAYNALTTKVYNMRVLRGTNVAPVVKLSAKPMKTKFGVKMRPDFEIVEFREIGGGGGPLQQIESPKTGSGGSTEQIGKPVKEPTTAEELNDGIPF
jgi:hypothetical protein